MSRALKTTAGDLAGEVVTEGSTGRSVERFLGIPYASPPVGPLRFAPPVPPSPWSGTRPSVAFGPSAPQRTAGPLVEAVPGMAVGATDEDCLTLNVWAPAGAGPGDDLPVLVWVHGGAYLIGGSSLATYDGARLCASEDVVVVSCNYRLGALGFLTLPDGAANLGLRDQLAALAWVQGNVAAVGGDPAGVTAFGESAGAGSLFHLLGAPAHQGLFRRAIVQSPGGETIDRTLAEDLGRAFVRHAGLPAGELWQLPVERVLDAQEAAAAELADRFGAMPWAPVVDGDLVPEDPRVRLGAGGGRDVEVLLGTTAAELHPYALPMVGLAPEAVATIVRRLLTPIWHRDPGLDACVGLLAAYGRARPGDEVDVLTEVLSDAAMGVPALGLSDAVSRHQPRTFSYVFDWPAPGVGACHAIDLPFTFGTLERDGWAAFVGADADAHRLSGDVMASWAAFARSGDPSTERVGAWPPYDEAKRQTMVLGRQCSVVEHPLAERLHLHDDLMGEDA